MRDSHCTAGRKVPLPFSRSCPWDEAKVVRPSTPSSYLISTTRTMNGALGSRSQGPLIFHVAFTQLGDGSVSGLFLAAISRRRLTDDTSTRPVDSVLAVGQYYYHYCYYYCCPTNKRNQTTPRWRPVSRTPDSCRLLSVP